MTKYQVIAHRRDQKFIKDINQTDQSLKNTIIEQLTKLKDYPLSLREMDIEKIKGIDSTFRIRIGKLRIIFYADTQEKKIYITHIEARKKAYTNI